MFVPATDGVWCHLVPCGGLQEDEPGEFSLALLHFISRNRISDRPGMMVGVVASVIASAGAAACTAVYLITAVQQYVRLESVLLMCSMLNDVLP